jgi:septation ring formation regulator EzrA
VANEQTNVLITPGRGTITFDKSLVNSSTIANTVSTAQINYDHMGGLTFLTPLDTSSFVSLSAGNVVATRAVSGAKIYAKYGGDVDGTNSDEWSSVYSTTQSYSASWSSGGTEGNSAYTTVNQNSADWDSTYTSVNETSADWDTTYTSVKDTSADWDSTYTSVKDTSADWDSTYTSVKDTSADWDTTYTSVKDTSADWDTTYTSVKDTSADWDTTYTSVKDTSADWDSTYTSVNGASASWNSTYTSVKDTSASWNSTYTSVKDTSADWDTTYTSVKDTSADWDSTYTTLNTNSAGWLDVTESNTLYFKVSGGTVYGDVNIQHDLVVGNNLFVTGSATFAHTVFTSTSALSVINTGKGPALYVRQGPGPGDIASFYDADGIEALHIGDAKYTLGQNPDGVIGIKTSFPNKALTVVGDISATDSIFTTGKFLSAVPPGGPSIDLWDLFFDKIKGNSIYTSVKDTSADWDSTYTSVNDTSADWDTTYTSVKDTSADWDTTYTSVKDTSADWDSTYTSVNSTSASWNSTYTSVKDTSASWNSTYTSVKDTSADWDSTYTSVNDTSADWDSTYSSVNSTSASWNSTYTSVKDTSASWNSTYTSVKDTSADWDSTYTSVNSTSASWNSTYTSVKDTSADWDSTYTSVNDTSADWDSTYTSVKDTSADWDSTYTTVGTYSAAWLTEGEGNALYLPLTGGAIVRDVVNAGGRLSVYGGLSAATTENFVIKPNFSPGNNSLIFADNANNSVGIRTNNPQYTLHVNGDIKGQTGYYSHIAAETKSFYINHPSKPGMHLQYGSLESPYHGIRLTGSGIITDSTAIVTLPDYVPHLVHADDVVIQLTNYQHNKDIWVDEIHISLEPFKSQFVVRKGFSILKKPHKFFWSFTAIRKDIPYLQVEV